MILCTTQRLDLHRFNPEAAGRVADYLRENRDYMEPWSPLREEDFFTVNVQREVLSRPQNREWRLFLTISGQEEVIGSIAFSGIERGIFQSCYLGYDLLYSKAGNGYMTEALQAALSYVFAQKGLHRVQANVMPRNTRSIALLERLGFKKEGYHPDYLKIAGRWEDHISYALLAGA